MMEPGISIGIAEVLILFLLLPFMLTSPLLMALAGYSIALYFVFI